MTPGAHTCLGLGSRYALDGSPWDISTSNDIGDFVIDCVSVNHVGEFVSEAQKAVFGLVLAGKVVIIAYDFAINVIGN